MPAWITSLLRDEVPVPMASAASTTTTSRPASASARAIARPTTPAPTTRQSIRSMRAGTDPHALHLHRHVALAGAALLGRDRDQGERANADRRRCELGDVANRA